MRPLLAICILFAGNLAFAEDWPEFRGPQGDGHTGATRLPISWGGVFEPAAWQARLPGRGWSSPIVIGNRIFLTTAEETALAEKDLTTKLRQIPFGEQEFQSHASVVLMAVEIDFQSGKLVRQIPLFTSENPAPIHSTNSYASPTPVSDGQRLYCHFGSLGTACVDLRSNEVVWKKRFEVDEITGPGSSPVLCDDRLILSCDGVDEQFVVALDKLTGEVVWQTSRPKIDSEEGKHRRAFSTPIVIEHQGRKQIISVGAQWAVAYDPSRGDEWWRVNFGTGHAAVPRPVYRDGVVYVCTGYTKPSLWAIRVDGTGDVTETHVVWKFDRQVPEISSPIIVDQEIYFVSNLGILTCLDLSSGELVWQHRLDGNFAASPLAAGDRIYITSEEGITTIFTAGREYQEVAQNQLFGHTMASLAVAGDAILLRTDSILYCIQERPR